MRTRIKFCGLVRAEDVDAAVALGVDAIGFVFYPKSPRALSLEAASGLRARLPSFVQAVGLFVNATTDEVVACASRVGLDVLQFHGDETPEQARAQAAAAGLPWWHAVRMSAETDLLSSVRDFQGAECFVLDSHVASYGGAGIGFDWSWVPAPHPARLILSGGLDADRVGEAIARVGPFGVDVSSGIQGADPRHKDRFRMERFVAAVAAADSQGL